MNIDSQSLRASGADHPATPARPAGAGRAHRRTMGAVTAALVVLGATGVAGAQTASARPAGPAPQRTITTSVATPKPVRRAPVGAAATTVPGATTPQVLPAAGLTAAPAGALAPTTCTGAGTVKTCDLYAMTGTTSILGRSIPIWGFSTTGAAGSASAPGPALVFNQGDTVTLVLHNQLSTPMSLALPGIPASAFTAGFGATAQETGVGTNGTLSVTFVANRPGTYLYEAGHTANGARQVAMGLAGALVVRATDGTAYNSAATAYQDEVPLVLSEIDPALNANPLTFDLREFRPSYRLINGQAFPEAPAIPTDQGHRVLLRYVNAGSLTHPMSLLGADQLVVGGEGHPLAYPQPMNVATVMPGTTLDAIATMPSGAESKVTLYESASMLHNNSQTTADPTQTAPGGMMAFLDTAAPAPVGDTVGPATTRVTVGPNPSDGLLPVTITADLTDVSTGNSDVIQAEYVIDDAAATGSVAPGSGTPLAGAFGAPVVTGATATITPAQLALLDAGRHQVLVRGLDRAGQWGALASAVLNLPKTGPSTTNGSVAPSPASASTVVVKATGDDTAAEGTINGQEYFVDTVGANGTGLAMARNRTAAVVSVSASIPATTVAGLSEGTHHVFVHTHDSLGLWGPPLDIPLVIDHTGPTVNDAAVGPNPTNGVLSDQANPGYLVVSANITDRDAAGGLQSKLVDAEAFLDPTVANPPGGSGLHMLASDGALDSNSEGVYGLIPVSQITGLSNGNHIVSVRGKDAAGNWGTLFPATLVVDRTAPVLSGLSATPNPTSSSTTLTLSATANEANFRAAEFWIGTDPGVGRGTLVPISLVNGKVVVSVPLVGVAVGSKVFGLRAQDSAGNWSNALTATVSVTKLPAIFSDTFNSGTLSAWSGLTGNVTVTSRAGLPTGSASNPGLEVNLPGRTNNRPSYVTDNTPAAETTYDAQVDINANTLTTGTATTAIVNLFETRSPTNTQVYALQYRGSGATAAVRVLLNRPGLAAVAGNWITLGAGKHTLKTSWRAGPATGTGVGEVVLRRDSAVVSTVTGRTTGLTVETAWLGLTGGVNQTSTSPMAGTLYLDSFVSTRVGP